MIDHERRRRGLIIKFVTTVLIFSSAAYLIWSLRALISPILLGILLAYLFRPTQRFLRYRWLPNTLRMTLIFTVLTGGILLCTHFIKESIPGEKEKLEILVRVKYKFNEKFDKLLGINPTTKEGNSFYKLFSHDLDTTRSAVNTFLELSPEQNDAFDEYYDDGQNLDAVHQKFFNYFLHNTKREHQRAPSSNGPPGSKNLGSFQMSKETILRALSSIVSTWFLLPVVFLFFLLDEGSLSHFIVELIPNRYFELALTVKEEVDQAIGKYLRGITLECTLVGMSMALGFFLVGVPFKIALGIGLLSGFASGLPFLGPVMALSLGLTYALIAEELKPLGIMSHFINMDNILIAVAVVIGLVIAIDKVIFQPFVLAGAVNMHPLVVILGFIAGSILFGPPGLILAIPALVVLKVVMQHTYRGLKDYRII